MAAVTASGKEQGRHGAARRQLGTPFACLPAMNILSKESEEQNLYQNWLTYI
jgi:hypothetical protein